MPVTLTEQEKINLKQFMVDKATGFSDIDLNEVQISTESFVQSLPTLSANLQRDLPTMMTSIQLNQGQISSYNLQNYNYTPIHLDPFYLGYNFGRNFF